MVHGRRDVRSVCLVSLLIVGCHTAAVPPPRWESPRAELGSTWAHRREHTSTCALLATVEYKGPPRDRSFTLELFFRKPGEYLLRGRGTLGVEGFRARVQGDSIVLLLERQNRGYSGAASGLPPSTRHLWRLLRDALPWLVGDQESLDGARFEYAPRGDRPARLNVAGDSTSLELEYARYRDEYPWWHLRSATGRSPEAELALSIRQQLYNTQLDSLLFELKLPADTEPLLD